ncbi:hypothetical protein ACK4CS_16785 [Enterococcus gallinarum]|uniref:Uncharacterized protein n=1 Tax=Enterococcus gallinarum TaxID=1353 RepID=A0A376GX03_ENTGA|nr:MULTISPECIES: hypothetical protein [Enterococcus]MDT2688221.1 hypothetical protein [Enterococcus gallinarum]MDT2691162.1 hypothetical protein [Enterococcus gallinarum]CAI3304253.1 LysM peptidoglycan-binding domain-containing protein [Enterococcus cecorum]CAI3370079.1 LysM peptidoglycan-binding domain-containing protein [Enterococcus cecorum]CAI3460133.1 LysM peptidoglycan-binding domain-containing protein [Enterococcus cecorum]
MAKLVTKPTSPTKPKPTTTPKVEAKPAITTTPKVESKPEVTTTPKVDEKPAIKTTPKVEKQPTITTVPEIESKVNIEKSIKTLDKLSSREISNLSLKDLKEMLPNHWNIYENNGRVHVKDGKVMRIRIDPADNVTKYQHMHIYDINGNSLDINGNIVERNSPSAHIPWNDK